MKAVITRFDQGKVFAKSENKYGNEPPYVSGNTLDAVATALEKVYWRNAEDHRRELPLHPDSYLAHKGGDLANNTCMYKNKETMHKGDVIEVVIVNNQFRIK